MEQLIKNKEFNEEYEISVNGWASGNGKVKLDMEVVASPDELEVIYTVKPQVIVCSLVEYDEELDEEFDVECTITIEKEWKHTITNKMETPWQLWIHSYEKEGTREDTKVKVKSYELYLRDN